VLRTHGEAPKPIVIRRLGQVRDILEWAKLAGFDPNAEFRSRYGQSPWDLLTVDRVVRVGFENRIEARSICPPLDDPIFISFTSAKFIPQVGEHISFSGSEISVLDRASFQEKRFKASTVPAAQLDPPGA
jgi:hypothetical protein